MNLQINKDKNLMKKIFIKSAKLRKRITKKPQRRMNNYPVKWKD